MTEDPEIPASTRFKSHNVLEGYLWPDPDPVVNETLRVDNVTRMNSAPVDRIMFPNSEEEVRQILEENMASDHPKSITVRGTQHCMGGQAIPSSSSSTCVAGSMVVDTKFLAHLNYDTESGKTISVGPGCQWSDVLRFLNRFGKAPKTMQSYATFSIGGTISVNAHGITTDTSLVEDVVCLRLVRYSVNETETQVRVETLQLYPTDELFGLVVGGYGLFGIVTEVTLLVTDNCSLIMDSISAKVVPEQGEEESEFQRIWKASQSPTSEVRVKLARLNIHSMRTATIYLFRKASHLPVAADLPLEPREMSPVSRLLYKWALPLVTDVRMSIEEASGAAMDMTGPASRRTITQNELLYESAIPLAKLYSPLAVMETTSFVLQEFFCPDCAFVSWVQEARPIFDEIHSHKNIVLLNATIRYVKKDAKSFLNYATVDMFAFVLYFRIDKVQDSTLGEYHNRLAALTLALGGTFYLPYRHCYSLKMMQQAYPQVERFARLKELYDPYRMFSSSFFDDYLLQFCTYDKKMKGIPMEIANCVQSLEIRPSYEDFERKLQQSSLTRYSDANKNDRSCFDVLMLDICLRQQFHDHFLENVFNIEDPKKVMRAIAKATLGTKSGGVLGAYSSLYETFQKQGNGAFSGLPKMWRTLRQISSQKKELTRETCSILHRMGVFGKLRSYVSVGDHGKIVLNLHRAGTFATEHPLVYIVHNFIEGCESDPFCILERGSMEPVGHKVQYDYTHDDAAKKLELISSNSVDLVTINQGLHHIPPNKQLYGFLNEVYRILRPGGFFIFREHNLVETTDMTQLPGSGHRFTASIEILDLAHSLFNAVSGVPPHEESQELRGFRSINEWKIIVRSFGFQDTFLIEVDTCDPTCDLMLCFTKEGRDNFYKPIFASPPIMKLTIVEPMIAKTFRALLSQLPSSALYGAKTALKWILSATSGLVDVLEMLAGDSIGNKTIKASVDVILRLLGRSIHVFREAEDLLRNIHIRETVDFHGLLSMPELFLLLPCLKLSVNRDPEGASELEKEAILFVETYLPSLLLDDEKATPVVPSADRKLGSHLRSELQSNVSMEEIMETLQQLVLGIPGLLDPQAWLPCSGFTLSQQSALLALIGGATSVDFLALRLSQELDCETWLEMKAVMVGDSSRHGIPTIVSCGDPPSKVLLLSSDRNHPWHELLKSYFHSSSAQLHPRGIRALKWIGLSEVVSLYEKCKMEASLTSNHPTVTLNHEQARTMRILGASTLGPGAKDLTICFNDNTNRYDLLDVGEIISARFGYKSLTSDLTDITKELSEYLRKIRHSVNTSKATRPGWLPLEKHILETMRNSRASLRTVDTVRRKVVGIGTLGMAGSVSLVLSYKPLYQLRPDSSQRDTEIRSSRALCDVLEKSEMIRGNIHNNDGHYMWFKLCEWMLVDILEKFGSSLDHTPWYFFPFIDCVKLYFDVLFLESKVVAYEYGPMKAFASQAFLTDLVPGLVMAAIFAQLQAVSFPLASVFPAQEADMMVEEIIFHASIPGVELSDSSLLTNTFRSLVDGRICTAECIEKNLSPSDISSLFRISVPTYKAMGSVIVHLALKVPTARILQISGLDVVQVRVGLDKDEADVLEIIQTVNSFNGVEVLFHYRFPCDVQADRMKGKKWESKWHLALRVSVLSLVSLIQVVEGTEGASIDQIYEVWTGW